MSKKEYLCKQLDSYTNSTFILLGIYIVTTVVGLIGLKKN